MFWKIAVLCLLSLAEGSLRYSRNYSKEDFVEEINKVIKPAPRILIISFDKVGGHASCATALIEFMQGDYNIDLIRTEDFERYRWFKHYKVTNTVIVSIVQRIHHLIHNLSLKLPRTIVKIFYRINVFKQIIEEEKYDLVIFTSPLHWMHVNQECIKANIPCMTLLLDYGQPTFLQSFWLRNKSASYLMPNKNYFIYDNYLSAQTISGIPIRPEFRHIRNKTKAEAKQELGLGTNKPCILVSFGATGANTILKVARAVRKNTEYNFVFLCGLNEKLQNKITKMNCAHFIVKSYIKDPSIFMRAADVFIGKPGATSVSEVLQCETPCIFKISNIFSVTPIEEWSAKYIEDHGYGVVIKSYKQLSLKIAEVLATEYKFKENYALDQAVLIIRKMLQQKQKWVSRFYGL